MEIGYKMHPLINLNQQFMKKLVLLITMLFVLSEFTSANSRLLTGKIFDAQSKKPLPGAYLHVEGTNISAQTDTAGAYKIQIPNTKATLVIGYLGFETQRIKPGNRATLNIYLRSNVSQLNEVVVIGYGSVKKTVLTGSVSNVNKAAATNVLQGKIAGISVQPGRQLTRNKIIIPAPSIPDNESYKGIRENSFLNPENNPLSTFSVDVDAASYSNVRRFINNGQLPPKDAVRIEEMINYFHYDLAGPDGNKPVAIHTELSTAPWNSQHRLLRIALKAREVNNDKLPASNLVFLIDVSGSMNAANKLPLVQSSLKLLVDQLRPKDKVSLVVYAGAAGLVLLPTSGDKKTTIKDAIDQLSAGGSTAGGEGIKLAYQVAAQNLIKHGNNRVILATDGDFNVGASSDNDMESLIEHERKNGVFLSVLGFGMGNYKDSKMETLADKGNGNYAYIDNITEARKTLVSEFGGTLFTVAKDVKLQLEFNPAKVAAYRLIGYENRILDKEDFNNDLKDAGDMGAGHNVTAFYEIIPIGVKDSFINNVDQLKYQKTEKTSKASLTNEMVTIKFRYKEPNSSKSKISQAVVMDQPKALDKTSVDYRFAAAVAEIGMLLRNSDFKQQATFKQALNMARAAKGEDKEGYRAEFIKLTESAKLLSKSSLASVE